MALWVAAEPGAHHFRRAGQKWLDARDGKELFARLSCIVSELSTQAALLRGSPSAAA